MRIRAQSPCRFTLIELLVVIGIIAVLASMLLPVMGQARLKAKTTAANNNAKQMLAGAIMYADDNTGYLYQSPAGGIPDSATVGPINETPNLWKRNPNLLEYLANEYDFAPATGHDVVGAAPWDHFGNTAQYCWSPWFYFPGYQIRQYPYTPQVTAPTQISRARGEHVMWSEVVCMVMGGSSEAGYFRGVYIGTPKRGGPDPALSSPYENTSFRYNLTQDPGSVKGTYGSYYDGHVEWVPFARMVNMYFYVSPSFGAPYSRGIVRIFFIPQPM